MDSLLTALPTILACTLALTVGGVVKGVISLGLPLVGMPLLMMTVDVPTAINILMIPLVLSNLVQAVEGGGTATLLRRFGIVHICLCIGTLIGTTLAALLEQRLLLLIIGPLAILFSAASLLKPDLAVPARVERWVGPPIGFLAGVIGGMSTLFGPILALYVVGLRLPRDVFVKAISMLYVTASTSLMLGGASNGSTNWQQFLLSGLAMIPVYGGMMIGQRIRHRLNPEKFRLFVLIVVMLTGANMIRAALRF